MAAVLAGLGALNALHTVGMVRATKDHAPARMMASLALAGASASAVCLSANLFTLFVANQALTLAVFPLVAHAGDERSAEAARTFLGALLAGSVGLFLPAIVWTYALAGALDFQTGGMLAGRVDAVAANVLLTLFVFGSAMAAIPPLHRWLTVSSGAPYPALALIQAIGVLPAGCVSIIKVGAFVFGPALHDAAFASRALILFAGAVMCGAALIAISKQDLRERLAYSCIAQSLAVVIGVLLALPAGLFAATLQTVAIASGAVTAVMALGTVSAVTAREKGADFAGLGRVMPWTLGAFAVAAASLIGMPPFAGAWAKLWLITASAGAKLLWAAALIGLAAILTFIHLGPLAANALARKAPADAFSRPDGASVLLVAPVVLSALATLALLLLADPLATFLAPMWTPRP
jgi:multicomponent Na+:H+ antiporter subunit D